MNTKLSARMLDVLRAIDAHQPLNHGTNTISALWSRGLIEDVVDIGAIRHRRAPSRWRLTAEGRLALQHGRQMLTRRTP